MRTFEAKKEIEDAVRTLSADHLMGYLAATSKPELPVRDKIACHFHKRYPRLVAAREYTVNSEKDRNLRKRVDLALLAPSCVPVVLVEFKAMTVTDPLRVPEHRNMRSLVRDLERLAEIHSVPSIGVMLMVDVENGEQGGACDGVIKYIRYFRRFEKEPKRIEKATEIASRFFQKAGLNVTPLSVELGLVWGASVKLICFILEPQRRKRSATLKRKLERVQRLVRRYVKAGMSLADELIAERRK